MCVLVNTGDCEYAVKYCRSDHARAVMCSYMYRNDSAALLYLSLHIWMAVHAFIVHVFSQMAWLCMHCHMHAHIYIDIYMYVCKLPVLSQMSSHIPCDCACTVVCVYVYRANHLCTVSAYSSEAWSLPFAGVEDSWCFACPWHPPLGHRDSLCPSCHSSLKMLVLFVTLP